MIPWEWGRQSISTEEVLDAAKAIPVTHNWITFDLTADWNWQPPEPYLEWAKEALQRGGPSGWDAAAGWAKRAVCRRMDGILAHNHLVGYLGNNYKKKAELLAKLKIPGLNMLRDTVIDPRNGIGHEYERATEEQAQKACEMAELFLLATEKEAAIPAIGSLGWNADYYGEVCTVPGQESERHMFGLTADHAPMLVIDHYALKPVVLITHPKDQLLLACPLKGFSSDQIIALNGRMRRCLSRGESGSYCFSSRRMALPESASAGGDVR